MASNTIQLRIENMTCGGCLRSVSATLKAMDEEIAIEAKPEQRWAKITTKMPKETILEILSTAGWQVTEAL